MIEAIAGILGAIIGAYVQAHYSERAERRQRIQDLIDYLREIASCLDEMERNLRQGVVPTAAGNRLEKALERFDTFQAGTKLDAKQKSDLATAHATLKHHLSEGKFQDDIIRGKILYRNDVERDSELTEMTRTAAYLRGTADTLKSTLT